MESSRGMSVKEV